MEDLNNIISSYNCECLDSERKIKKSDISIYENELGIKFGTQLTEYILNYGYIACEFVEICGINLNEGVNSDMIKATKRVQNLSDKVRGLIVVEDQGDGDYYLVDSEDNMYRFVSDTLTKMDIDLFQYIKERLEKTK